MFVLIWIHGKLFHVESFQLFNPHWCFKTGVKRAYSTSEKTNIEKTVSLLSSLTILGGLTFIVSRVKFYISLLSDIQNQQQTQILPLKVGK